MVALGANVVDNTVPEPALYGLLSSAVNVVNDDSSHWQNNFTYDTLGCSSTVKVQSICSASQTVTSSTPEDGNSAFLTYFPFAVQTEFACSTMSRTPDEVQDLAERAIEACTQKAIEKEFWTGELAKVAQSEDAEFPNRYLASDSATDITPAPEFEIQGVKSKHGLALLERAIADCGCGIRGTIHATIDVASTLGLKGKDGALETNLGNKVVAGAGYSGTGPDGTAAPEGTAWMYATGPVTVRLGPVDIVPDEENQAIDTKANTTLYKVDRPAAVTWNSCCHYAVLVNLTLDYS